MARANRTAAYLAAAAAIAGCATPPARAVDPRPPEADPRPPAVLVAPPQAAAGYPLDDGPHHDPSDPAAVAIGVVLDGLAAEGLLVTTIDAEIRRHTATAASVRVTVAHSLGHGHPHQSTYHLDLGPGRTGWQVTSATEPDP